jgi:uncharacterized protein (DUF885 family)
MRRFISVALLATLSPAALAQASSVAPAPSVSAPAETAAAQALHQLFKDSDEASLKRNPLNAIFRGDMRYADQFGDYITDAYFAAEKKANEDDMARLAKIDRAQLNATDQIAYDVFKWDAEQTAIGYRPDILKLNAVRPLNHFYGFHTFYPTFSSGKGGAPFATVADYENALKRHRAFVIWIDRAIDRFKEGKAAGIFETKMTITNVIGQLDAQLAQSVEDSPYYGPIKALPADFSAADKARLTSAYRAAITDDIYPAYRRLRDYLKSDYLPAARDQVGLSAMKGGAELYKVSIENTTTLPLDAETVHQTGLSEVTRITSEMEKVKAEVGFTGTLAQFFDYLRDDPKFKMASRQALTQGYYDIGKQVDGKIGSLFAHLPKAPLEIRPYEEFREKYEAGGSYEQGTPDGKRPGIFYFNAYDLPSRTIPGMTTLYLHEGAPGHHFQISLAQENEALPNFMRFGGNTAYVEGWALYAETLGYEMGFYKDPYQRFGTLSDEMLRAMRLVVDTGIHAKGWTREQAIDYMMAHSDMGRTDATAEVERYIAIPSQALAYKTGAMTIQRLRKKAEAALGAKFDIRAFHDQVLNTGALPLAVLEKKIDSWIAASK